MAEEKKEYEIYLDLINYEYRPVDSKLQDYIFGGNSFDTGMPAILEGDWDKKLHTVYYQRRIRPVDKYKLMWKLTLASDKEAKETAKFLVEKTQAFLKNPPHGFYNRTVFPEPREILTEIYRLERVLVK